MKKQPKLILRESCVADVTTTWPAGRFIEMGAGTGHMTRIYLDRGFTGACHDIGHDSRQIMRRNLADAGKKILVVDELDELDAASFDYLFAFEVLEHVEDDMTTLRSWMHYLKPGGRIVLSVPAHARKFGKSDELVGHVRRYEKRALVALLSEAGAADINIVNYGYPVTELTRWFSNQLIRNDRSYDSLTQEQRSISSAQRKPAIINTMLSLLNGSFFIPFAALQRLFYSCDLGDGYVAWATKGVTIQQ